MTEPRIGIVGDRVVAVVECEACEDGWVFSTYTNAVGLEREQAAPCAACAESRRRAQLFTAAGVPLRFARARLSDKPRGGADQREAIAAVQAWISGVAGACVSKPGTPPRFDVEALPGDILLCGPTGVGKTHILVGAVVEATLGRGLPCRYFSFSKLARGAKGAVAEGRSTQSMLDDLAQVPVLMLDELGAGRASPFELELVHALICDRYDAMRPTLWATNYAPPPVPVDTPAEETLESRMGSLALSRLMGTVQDRAHWIYSHDLRLVGSGTGGEEP